MKTKKAISLILTLMLTISLGICAFSGEASAVLSKNGSITLHVADANTGEILENAGFRLYFFAEAHEKANGLGYEYVFPYDECKILLNDLQDAYLPIHLTNFALTRSLPYEEKVSDKSGTLIFNNLTPGIYLIVASGNVPEYFVPAPFVINIPLFDKNHQDWVYDINATPKMQIYSASDATETTYISVKKLWDTNTEHPDSVTVSLLCDFEEKERIVLSDENNWTYKWESLSKRHSWSVVETFVPDGYVVSYETSSNTVTITNKKVPRPNSPRTRAQHSPREKQHRPTKRQRFLIQNLRRSPTSLYTRDSLTGPYPYSAQRDCSCSLSAGQYLPSEKKKQTELN